MPKPTTEQVKSFENLIYSVATSNGIPRNMALLLVSQSKHETANFSSNVFWDNKNMFGYKFVKGAKYQLSAGRISTEGDPYAKYESYTNSILELVAYLKRRVAENKFPPLEQITTSQQYAELLKKVGYYGDPLTVYLNGLKRFFNSDIGRNSGNIAALLLLLLICAYIVIQK